ncbi:Uu.00g018210.m01.CDS01 [Anthostomella pinea]|uniref:Uu.00g018210.m01.CDS01 n=1 Tax=Anthostomella pinea TaxID=933095 RepID=A0AAI8VZ25_9PEZI|nr:Uu.00g018210.m01.CDS01 [Anthostomella pinea]
MNFITIIASHRLSGKSKASFSKDSPDPALTREAKSTLDRPTDLRLMVKYEAGLEDSSRGHFGFPADESWSAPSTSALLTTIEEVGLRHYRDTDNGQAS